jgi:hypothetical protein
MLAAALPDLRLDNLGTGSRGFVKQPGTSPLRKPFGRRRHAFRNGPVTASNDSRSELAAIAGRMSM